MEQREVSHMNLQPGTRPRPAEEGLASPPVTYFVLFRATAALLARVFGLLVEAEQQQSQGEQLAQAAGILCGKHGRDFLRLGLCGIQARQLW
eukprot:scaffold1117_cov379-Prasinococcus_capsulatus_cf.AAC.4